MFHIKRLTCRYILNNKIHATAMEDETQLVMIACTLKCCKSSNPICQYFW